MDYIPEDNTLTPAEKAGILARDGHAYALVVYTKGEDLGSVPERTDVIHQITAAVTDALF